MHADGDWQTVQGVPSKDMVTIGEYLQTWKLKLSPTRAVLSIFHLNNKETKREVKVNHNNDTLLFCSKPKYLKIMLDKTLEYLQHFESLCKKLTSRVVLLRRLALSSWGSGTKTLPTATLTLVHSTAEYCTSAWCCSAHTCLIDPAINDTVVNCDWMPASYNSGQSSYSHRYPTYWASLQRIHTFSSTTPHGAWTSAPLSAHLSIRWQCIATPIETPICSHQTTHQFIWWQ